jgi:hypothetical protein
MQIAQKRALLGAPGSVVLVIGGQLPFQQVPVHGCNDGPCKDYFQVCLKLMAKQSLRSINRRLTQGHKPATVRIGPNTPEYGYCAQDALVQREGEA